MNLNEKLQEFEESLNEIVSRDYRQIEKNVEKEIKQGIEQELVEYEAKKQNNFDKNVKKIEKDFNKNIFNYEMNCKKEIIDEEKKIKNKLKEEAIKKLIEFTESNNYQEFLNKCIKNGISLINDMENTFIGLTKKDIEKYQNIIKQNYNINIKEINSKYIGGCILENESKGIFIDNTLLNSINEQLDG